MRGFVRGSMSEFSKAFLWLILFASCLILPGLALAQLSTVLAQQPSPTSNPVRASAPAADRLLVRIDSEAPYFITLRANDLPLTEVAAELARRLKVPVILSKVMQRQRVSADFEAVPLETALRMLAPFPYVHYELRGGGQAKCLGVYLNAYNEPVPRPKLEKKSVAFMIQGNTESTDTADTNAPDAPLRILYDKNRLTVIARKQPLSLVLDRLATELGVNLVMPQPSDETVDLDFKELPLQEAIGRFPSSVSMQVTSDVQRAFMAPLLIELVRRQ